MSNFKISNIQYFHVNGARHTTFDIDKIGNPGEKFPTGVLVFKGWVDVAETISCLTDDDFTEILKNAGSFTFAEEVTQH